MSQFEQENDLGAGGGEVDGETLHRAWEAADERRAGRTSSSAPTRTTAKSRSRPPDRLRIVAGLLSSVRIP